MRMALAGPANRAGRIAGEHAATGAAGAEMPPVLGTSIVRVFDKAAAMTGLSEKYARKLGREATSVIVTANNHVGYYPGAQRIHIKLLFSTDDGRILGAQAVGLADVARRIDVIAMALQLGGTVFDLEEAELCYAPQYGAAKDPVNIAGMIAANHLRGDLPLADWSALGAEGVQVVDVRRRDEFAETTIPGAINIPLEEMRARLGELPRDREIWLLCMVGQRAYYATRALMQNGINVRNLSGGMRTYETLR